MARLRWVKSPEELAANAAAEPEFYESSITSLRAVYETDPAITAALVPAPLVPAERPEVVVACSTVSIEVRPGFSVELGSAIFGVSASYEGEPGTYLVTMVMTAEGAVVGGRERFGEPKKLGEVSLARDGDRVSASVSRMGISFIQMEGTVGEPIGAREYTDINWCFKISPSPDPGKALDSDPLLVRLEWRQRHADAVKVDGAITLEDSMLDPVADVPVRRLVRMEWDTGTALSNGRVIGPVAPEPLYPILHQRYDDIFAEGIEVGE